MLELRPITQKDAFAFVAEHHRHHKPPVGALWQHAICDVDGVLRGVAVVGRPVARKLDDGLTCEVTRLCTDGAENGCSMLYSAAWRAAQSKGFRRILTYILESESGASLRAAGWLDIGASPGRSWSVPSRPRRDNHPLGKKRRYGKGAWRELAA